MCQSHPEHIWAAIAAELVALGSAFRHQLQRESPNLERVSWSVRSASGLFVGVQEDAQTFEAHACKLIPLPSHSHQCYASQSALPMSALGRSVGSPCARHNVCLVTRVVAHCVQHVPVGSHPPTHTATLTQILHTLGFLQTTQHMF
eukprot:4482582-Amphidinium_carterae.1